MKKFIAIVLTVVLMSLSILPVLAADSPQAGVVVAPDGETVTRVRTITVVTPRGTQTFSFDEDRTVTIEGDNGYYVVLEIDTAGERVRVVESNCSDQSCVEAGWQSVDGLVISCQAANISIYLDTSTSSTSPKTASFEWVLFVGLGALIALVAAGFAVRKLKKTAA